MSDLRGFPTFYKGVWYRSRTEARHAMVFDLLGIKAHYEPQGYAALDIAYLPDFLAFAACGPIWVEIKPALDADREGVARWRKFASVRPHADTTRAALLTGLPAVEQECIVIGGSEDAPRPSGGPWESGDLTWCPCPAGIHFDLAYPGHFRSRLAEDGCPPFPGNDGEDRIRRAVTEALAAKFMGRPKSGPAA